MESDLISRPTLIVITGRPSSGKTTLSTTLAREIRLTRRITLIVEAAFQHKLWFPKLSPMKEIAQVRVIVCTIDAQLAKSRFIERGITDPERSTFHEDWAAEQADEMLLRPYEPPAMGVPTLHVDTSEGYQPGIDDIVDVVGEPNFRSDLSRNSSFFIRESTRICHSTPLKVI